MRGEPHGGSDAARRLTDPGTATARGTAPVIRGPGAAKALAAAAQARGPRPAGVLAAVIATLLLICGCTASRAPGPGTPGTARAPASPSPTAAQAAARSALAAYDGMWKEMQAAGVTANWQDPGLAKYASGKALNTLVTGLHNAHNAGLVIKGTLVTDPQVTSEQPEANPVQVVIRDCIDDSHWLNYFAATGKLQNNVPGGHRLTEALVTSVPAVDRVAARCPRGGDMLRRIRTLRRSRQSCW